MKLLLLFTMIITGCCHVGDVAFSLEDKAKWDFYKKNLERCFETGDSLVYYYEAEVLLETTSSTDTILCYFVEFTFDSLSSVYYRSVNVSCGTPLVSELCYNKRNKELVGEYIGNALIEPLSSTSEGDQDYTLEEFIRNNPDKVSKSLLDLYHMRLRG